MWRILRVEHLVPVAAAAIFLTAVRTRPQLAFGLEFGALLAPAVMVYLHRWAAFWATVACAVIWLAADRFGGSGLGALVVLPWGYAAAAWFVAGYRPGQVEQASPRRTVPAPAALPPIGVPAAGLAGAGPPRAGARRPGGGARPGQVEQASPRRTVPAPAALPPIGVPPAVLAVAILAGAVALGLVRSDAYAAIAAGTGVALLARTARRRRQLRALFGTPQPV